MTDLKTLRALAEAATKGPWKTFGYLIDGQLVEDGIRSVSEVDIIDSSLPYEETGVRQQADADYIAAVNPATIIQLLNDVDGLVEALETAEEEYDIPVKLSQALSKWKEKWGSNGK